MRAKVHDGCLWCLSRISSGSLVREPGSENFDKRSTREPHEETISKADLVGWFFSSFSRLVFFQRLVYSKPSDSLACSELEPGSLCLRRLPKSPLLSCPPWWSACSDTVCHADPGTAPHACSAPDHGYCTQKKVIEIDQVRSWKPMDFQDRNEKTEATL